MQRVDRIALALLVVGSLQIAGDLLGLRSLKGFAAATMLSPAPKVFSSVRGFETYSTRFFIDWRDLDDVAHTLELTPATYGRLRGPYHRRNVYGAALAYGPLLVADERARPMLAAILQYGLWGDAPLLRELGIDPATVRWPLHLRYEPLPGTDLNGLSTRIEVPLQ